jgi:2,3-bisphosphoglycerate-independent phosphoglycerate mutase
MENLRSLHICAGLVDATQDHGLQNVFIQYLLLMVVMSIESGKKNTFKDLRNYIAPTTVKLASVMDVSNKMDETDVGERIKLAYDLIVNGHGELQILCKYEKKSYQKGNYR